MRKVKGSATVELAYMMPIIFFAFLAAIYILFYLHDKTILIGAAYETAVVGTQKAKWDEEDIEEQLNQLFLERTRGKFIFFSVAQANIEVSEKSVIVNAGARKGRLKMSTIQKLNITMPEKYIRDLRRIQAAWKPNTNED